MKKLVFSVLICLNVLYSPLWAQIPSNGLVAWYPFNGNANDESGNGNHGVVNGATLTSDRFGNVDGAFQCLNQNILAPISSNNFIGDFTLSGWVWLNGFTGVNTYPGFVVGHNSFIVLQLANTVDPPVANFYFSAGIYTGLTDGNCVGDISLGVWKHILVSVSSGMVSMFVDGVFTNSNLSASIYQTNTIGGDYLIFGNGNQLPQEEFNGKIDDIAIYNRALSPSEIQQLYQDQTGQVQPPLTCNITAPTTALCEGESVTLSVNTTGGAGASSQLPTNLQQGLVAYYPFNGNANDESGNGNNGVVNGATLTSDRNGNGLSAYHFNNIGYIELSNVQFGNYVSSGFTLSYWFTSEDSTSVGDRNAVITNYDGVNGLQIEVYPGIGNNLRHSLRTASGNPPEINYHYAFTYHNVWRNAILVWDPPYMRTYMNGQLVDETFGSQITNLNVCCGVKTRIGSFGNGASNYKGKLDDFEIWNRSLSSIEIQQLYTAQSYAWSNNETTPTITVSPAENTTYTCTVTQGNQTCTASVDITVNPNVTNTISATIIEGESYTLGTQTLTTAGTYTEIFTSAAGCDSTVTLTLSVEPLLTCEITSPTTSLCEGESVTLSVNTTSGAGASSQLPPNLQQGLVAYYPFNGNANDESGNGNNGTVNGATLTSDRFGNVNKAYLFGTNQSITASITNNSIFSISAWVKLFGYNECTNTSVIGSTIVSHKNDGYYGNGFSIEQVNQQWSYLEYNGNSNYFENYAGSVELGSWYHVSYTSDAFGVRRMYINGVILDEYISQQIIEGGYLLDFKIASSSDNPTLCYFNGVIDDVGYWYRALSPSEIQQLYTAQSYAWSNNETTPTITVSPAENTTYTCTVTQGNQTCTASVDITVNPNVTNTISATIIEGESYTLGTQTLTTAGTYTEVFTSAAGCDSTVTLTLAVEPLLTCEITSPTTSLCEGESVTLSVNTTSGAGASSQLPANLQQGLVAYYPFNGNANDESGNGNDGVVNGATLTSDRFGHTGSAYSFDGVNSFIEILDNSLLDFVSNYSLASWIRASAFISSDLIVSSVLGKERYSSATGYGLALTSSGQVADSFNNVPQGGGSGLNAPYYSNETIGLSSWHHLVSVHNGSRRLFYLDGNLILDEAFVHQLIQSTQSLFIGKEFTGNNGPYSNRYFNGSIDDIGLWNRALSPSEIQQLFTAQSYAWSNNETTPTITVTPTQNTTYSCTVTQGNQTCTANVDITVNPNVTNSINATIIEGETYTLGTQTLTSAGTYTEVFTSAAGCDSTVTLTLSVEPLLTCNITAPTTTLCEGESVTLSVNTTGGTGASSQLPANLQQGLVAYYPFNGNANDESGNGNDGVQYGGVNLTPDQWGVPNSAYSFDGVNDAIEISAVSSMMPNNLSISFWLNPSSAMTYGHVIRARFYGYIFYFNGETLNFQLHHSWAESTWTSTSVNTANWDTNQWYYVTGTFDGSYNRLYVNGIQVDEIPSSVSGMVYSSDGMIVLGRDGNTANAPGGSSHYTGKLDNVAFFDRALTPSEIQQLYTAQSYAWSNNETTPTITVSPAENTTYSCTVTQGNQTCTASVDITVNPNVTNAISATIIEGETYTLGAQTLTTAGTYTEVFTSATGCDSTVTLTLNVEPLLTCNISAPTTTLCEGESVTLSVNTTSGASTSSQLPANLQQGLVAYYPFNGNANDESGNGNHGVNSGATLTADRNGNQNKAYSFNSQGGIVFSPVLNVTEYSASLWFSIPNSSSGRNMLTQNSPSNCTNVSVALEFYPVTQGLNVGYSSNTCGTPGSGGANIYLISDPGFFDIWHHRVVVMKNNGDVLDYVDGNLISQTNRGQFLWCNNPSASMRIGGPWWNSDPQNFLGMIDDVALFNRALSPSEIQQLYIAQSYAWSNNATTPTITVSPAENTTYTCTVTQGNQTCTASVDITVNPNVTNAISATIIEGESYTLGTQTLTTAGTYTEVFTSAAGCDSTVTLTLAVEPLLTCNITAPTTTLCEGESVTLSSNATVGNSNLLSLNIGEEGPAGGLIFYDKGFESSGWRYLEAAPSDIQMSSWGCMDQFITGASISAIGAGLSNSELILSQCGDLNSAAARCLNYSVNGKSNWHLPSKDEFNAMHQTLISQGLGNFATEPIPTFGYLYWTSTQFDPTHGWHYYGEEPWLFAAFAKVYSLYVRPVRYVSESEIQNYTTSWIGSNLHESSITVSPTQTTTYTATVTTATQTCTDEITITVNPLLTWYADADGDGFGNANGTTQACDQPVGFVADNTDCNDNSNNTYPGAEEICFDQIDNNCNGTVDENCAIYGCINPNACNFNPAANTDDGSCILPQPEICDEMDNDCDGWVNEDLMPADLNSTLVVTAVYPVCTTGNLFSANLNNGANSAVIEGDGPDLWYRLTAQYNTLRVGLTAAAGDNSIQIYQDMNGCLMLVSEEHEQTSGNQILLTDGLVTGETYYVAIHQNAAPTNPSAKVCFTHLLPSICDHAYSGNTGVYSSVCRSFKAQYRANALHYIFNIQSATESGLDLGITPWSYTTATSSAIVTRLGTLLPANFGSLPKVYTLDIPVVYGLYDAANQLNTITAQATQTCTITLLPESAVSLRTTDRCPNVKAINQSIATDRSICGAQRYEWELTQVMPTAQAPITVLGGLNTNFLFLNTVPGMANGKTYNVRVRPIHSTGVVGEYGVAQCMKTTGAGMVMENHPGSAEPSYPSSLSQARVEGEMFVLFPNPTSCGRFTLYQRASSNVELTNIKILDINGNLIYKSQVVMNGNAIEVTFGDLASGVYVVVVEEERMRLLIQ